MDRVAETEELRVLGPRFLSELTIDSGGVPQIVLHGDLDMSSADELRDTVDGVLKRNPQMIIFDAGELDFLDSAGIAVLVYAASKVHLVRLVRTPPIVRRVVSVSGLEGILVLDPAGEDAEPTIKRRPESYPSSSSDSVETKVAAAATD
jgi:anti-anti-sigma factor